MIYHPPVDETVTHHHEKNKMATSQRGGLHPLPRELHHGVDPRSDVESCGFRCKIHRLVGKPSIWGLIILSHSHVETLENPGIFSINS